MAADIIRREQLGSLREPFETALADLVERDAFERLRAADHTLWSPDPTEITDRLGWTTVADDLLADGDRLDDFRTTALADGFTNVLVMGMGGSSLFPEVIARSRVNRAPHDGSLHLSVLDSTEPEAVGHALAASPPERTLFITSSKSGTTIETRSHLDFFWERIRRPEAFIAITDPGSELATLGAERGFRTVFENRPDIGGRYSALSHFGMVPAALTWPDWRTLPERASALGGRDAGPDHPALRLGALLGAAVRAGRDKVTILLAPEHAAFGLWLEQLLAESTGKDGTGVIPIVGELPGPVDLYGDDRLFIAVGDIDHPIGVEVFADAGHPVVHLGLDDVADLGTQVLLWELATAFCGAVLGVNPFDQPNVAEAKAATDAVLSGETGPAPITDGDVGAVLAEVRPGDYLAIQAYVDPASDQVGRLEEVRLALRARHGVATTFGLGPRFLHSTGQLHKGGPPSGVFLQIVDAGPADLEIPGRDFSFGRLIRAQADGDLTTLRRHGLRVARTTTEMLERIVDADPPIG